MLTFLYPPSQFYLGVSVFAFTLAKAFVRELKCPAITRFAGSITCQVTQFLRGSLLSLSLTIRGTANELVPHIDFTRDFVVYLDNRIRQYTKSLKARLVAESWAVHFFKAVTRKLENSLIVFHRKIMNVLQFCD